MTWTRARQRNSPTGTDRWRRTSICCSGCATGEFEDGRAHAAGQDRHGASEPGDARSDPLSRASRRHHHRTGRRLVHLPDVRLRPLPVATRSRGSPTRFCTLEFLSITARSTTGCIQNAARDCPRTTRSRSSSRGSTSRYTVMSKRILLQSRRARLRRPAGTIRGCRRSERACAVAATRPRRMRASLPRQGGRREVRDNTIELARLEALRCATS